MIQKSHGAFLGRSPSLPLTWGIAQSLARRQSCGPSEPLCPCCCDCYSTQPYAPHCSQASLCWGFTLRLAGNLVSSQCPQCPLRACSPLMIFCRLALRIFSFLFFSFQYLFIWLPRVLVVACRIFIVAYRIFSCSLQGLSCSMPAGSSFLTRDRTRAPCTGSVES